MNKSACRRQFRLRIPSQARREAGEALLGALRDWPVYQRATLIASFWGLPWEVDTVPIHAGIWADGKALCLPRVEGPGVLAFYPAKADSPMVPGAYGIPEPLPLAPPVDPARLELVLTPCEAADPWGTRLGKGGGYYDRFLCLTDCPALALLLPHQFSPQALPRQPHDRLMDFYGVNGQIHPCERKLPHAE